MLFTDKSRLSGQPGERARVGRFFCALKNSLKIIVQKLARYFGVVYLCPIIHTKGKKQTMTAQNMIYPGVHSTATVETVFVNGYRLDICEVNAAHFDLLYNGNGASKPMARYFLEIENRHIVSYKAAEGYFDQFGECRWDFFCHAKSDIKKHVQDFEAIIAECISMSAKIAAKPAMAAMILPKLEYKKTRLLERFGIGFNYENHK